MYIKKTSQGFSRPFWWNFRSHSFLPFHFLLIQISDPDFPRMKFSRSVNWPPPPFPSQHFPATKKRAFPNADFERLYDISSNNKMADRKTAFDILKFSLVARPRRHEQRKLNGQVYSSVLFVPVGTCRTRYQVWLLTRLQLSLMSLSKW